MRRIIFSLTLVSLLVSLVSAQETSHSYDGRYEVQAYEVPADKESYFDINDGQLSAFWLMWHMDGIDPLDKIDLNGEDHHVYGQKASSKEDGQLNVRFAYSDSGVYILYEVRDDNWVAYLDQAEYKNDAVELFGAQHSQQELYQEGAALMPCMNDLATPHQLTEGHFQLQVRFGGSQLVDKFNRNRWKPSLIGTSGYDCTTGHGDGLIEYNSDLTFEDAQALYGIRIEIILSDDAWRRQEWFIPWSSWGGHAGLSGVPASNKVAISVGYNDNDDGHTEGPTAMRWRLADPYRKVEDNNGAPVSADAWGDLAFTDNLQTILDNAGKTWADVEGTGTINRAFSARNSGRIMKTEFFTVAGQKIKKVDGRLQAPASGLVLKKMTFSDNSSQTIRVPFSTIR